MSLQNRKQRIKYENIRKELDLSIDTVKHYFRGKLKNTATQRKIAKYLEKVHNEEIKGIIK